MSTAEENKETSETSGRVRSRLPVFSLVCTLLATIILGFLIPFGVLESCSTFNIALFMVLLTLSGLLAITGAGSVVIGLRRTRHRLFTLSLLLTILYIALLMYLLQLIKS